jgi:hypothetical protein
MSAIDHHRTHGPRPIAAEAATRRGGGENVIYILVIGLAGAIFANAVTLLGFILLASAK